MLVILVVGIAALLVSSLTSSSAKTAHQKNTSAALAQAKDALIGFAVTYGDTHSGQVHGYLPCPDPNGTAGLNGEGSSETCVSHDVSVIGRFPWKTLGLSALRDGDGECLWYAVSGTYKDNPKTTGLMNWDTDGQLQVYSSDGTLLANQVVAVIFAPGAPLSDQSQNRSPDGTAPICGGNYTVGNYLDTGTVNTVSFNNAAIASGNFIQGTSGGSINDQIVFITRQDIWNAVQKRTDFNTMLNLLTQRVAECLANYGNNNSNYNNNSLPWPAQLVLSDYAVNNNYIDVPNTSYSNSYSYSGRVPYVVNNSESASGNSISYPYSLLQSNGANCPNPANWAAIYPWYDNWKDHLFYALSNEFGPQYGNTNACGSCVTVNGNKYAAVVMFANSRIGTQVRTSSADRGNISNYLESNNATNYPDTSGMKSYKTATSSINDVLYCIKQDLSVVPCP